MDYRKLSIGLGFVVAFLAGCVVHDVVRVAPPVRAGVPVQRWEYECMEATENVAAEADKYGAKGWELAAAAGTARSMKWCFKRPQP